MIVSWSGLDKVDVSKLSNQVLSIFDGPKMCEVVAMEDDAFL